MRYEHAARDDAGVTAGGPAVHQIVADRAPSRGVSAGGPSMMMFDPRQLQCGERRGQTH